MFDAISSIISFTLLCLMLFEAIFDLYLLFDTVGLPALKYLTSSPGWLVPSNQFFLTNDTL